MREPIHVFVLIVFILVNFACAYLVGRIAYKKRRNWGVWGLFGFFFFIVALPLILLLKKKEPRMDPGGISTR